MSERWLTDEEVFNALGWMDGRHWYWAYQNRPVVSRHPRGEMQPFICPVCGKQFLILSSQVNTRTKKGRRPSCSRSCGAKSRHVSGPKPDAPS